MCFLAFPIVCDAQEPFADHLVIECEVLPITAVKIVETGFPVSFLQSYRLLNV